MLHSSLRYCQRLTEVVPKNHSTGNNHLDHRKISGIGGLPSWYIHPNPHFGVSSIASLHRSTLYPIYGHDKIVAHVFQDLQKGNITTNYKTGFKYASHLGAQFAFINVACSCNRRTFRDSQKCFNHLHTICNAKQHSQKSQKIR